MKDEICHKMLLFQKLTFLYFTPVFQVKFRKVWGCIELEKFLLSFIARTRARGTREVVKEIAVRLCHRWVCVVLTVVSVVKEVSVSVVAIGGCDYFT